MSDLRQEPWGGGPDADRAGVRLLLDAPPRRNALTLETVEELYAALVERPERTVLLGSTTPDVFSAGADLDVDDATRTRLSDRLYACYEVMVTRPGIVIAVVEGPAVGGGAQLTTAADLRVCSAGARWRWVGPGHGLAVGAWILPDLLGRSLALDLALTGRWLDAEEAVAARLVTRLAAEPWQIAADLAATLTGADTAALARVKTIVNHPGVLERLRREREENRVSWTGAAPTARAAAEEGRRSTT
jgi:enoyl-CoA hydratase/carnithine racemase